MLEQFQNSAIEIRGVSPFLKWAGGKRWFAANFLGLIPQHFKRYVEPFAGSAALFFRLQPNRSVLSDLNSELIETYRALANDWRSVAAKLKQHQLHHSDDYYYEIRASKPRSLHGKAARFIYLNRTCWNGLYRVNRHGQFNVPRGTKDRVLLPTDDFEATSRLLRRAELYAADFEWIIDQTGKGDFLFIDPPYTVKHNFNGFIKYNNKLFSWNDQVRLREALQRAFERGAQILLLNANHTSIRDLYGDLGRHKAISRCSILAADSSHRGLVEELAIQIW
jgi:DNA adenine methylase